MLLEFAVTNFRSFREKQVLSLLPSGKLRERYITPLQAPKYPKVQALPSAVLYGPNNAGKSNFLQAVKALNWLVTKSGNFNSDAKLEANEFFLFNKQTKNQPTIFEIDFIAPNQKRYHYRISFTISEILEEELYVFNISPKGKTTIVTLFEREKQKIKFTVALKGVKNNIEFAPNQLFLSRADIGGNEEIKKVYAFFSKRLDSYQFTETEYTHFLTRKYAEFIVNSPQNKIHGLTELILKEMNTGILGLKTDLADLAQFSFPEDMPQHLKDKLFESLKYELRTQHRLFDGEEEVGEESSSLEDESTGTRKLLGLIPLIIPSLIDGDTLFIDELNTSMHTEVTAWLIDLFNNPKTNPKQAQLIITTHDITLLRKYLYDKDQVFIIEKNKFGASEMYSFADITGLPKNNVMVSEFYETGRLGGVPHFSKPYLQHTISQFLADAEAKEQG